MFGLLSGTSVINVITTNHESFVNISVVYYRRAWFTVSMYVGNYSVCYSFLLFWMVRDEWDALISLKNPKTIHTVDSLDLFAVNE